MSLVRVPSASPYAVRVGFSAAVRAGDRVVTAGMTAVAADGAIVGADDPEAQAAEALRKALDAVEAAGGTAHGVVRCRMYVTRREDWEAVGRAYTAALGHVRPAATMVVCALLDERMLVEVELEAVVADPGPPAP